MTSDRLRRRFGAVRVRATVAALLVLGVALVAGGVVLVQVLRGSLVEGVESTAQAQVADVGALLRAGDLPARLPLGKGDTLTQVVSGGRVLASSPGVSTRRPISTSHPGEEGLVVTGLAVIDHDGDGADRADDPYLLLASSYHLASGRSVTVYVAGSLRSVCSAVGTVTTSLWIGSPIILLVAAVLVWVLAGRALHPVEAIRSEVAEITEADLHRRVPEPRSNDEIARLAETMNGMLDRLEGSARAQRQFVTDASHELRSPLATIQATLEVALAHPEGVDLRAVGVEALDETRRLRRLVDDLLVMARAGEDAAPTPNEPVDLDEILLQEARVRRRVSRVPLLAGGVSGGRVAGRPEHLERVVRNLLDNADRHASSRVEVSLTTAGGLVTLIVADDGPGIAESDRDRVFERFARVDEARTQHTGGAGLGLAIVRQLVELHGGTVTIDDAAQGARFVVRFPALEGPL